MASVAFGAADAVEGELETATGAVDFSLTRVAAGRAGVAATGFGAATFALAAGLAAGDALVDRDAGVALPEVGSACLAERMVEPLCEATALAAARSGCFDAALAFSDFAEAASAWAFAFTVRAAGAC